MTKKITISKDYQKFIETIKENIIRARHIAIRKINSELINLYYLIGKQIYLKQKETNWGDDLIGQMEKDLKLAFPDMSGFSRRNLIYMRQLYLFVGDETKVQQLVAQIPWGHIILLTSKIKDKNEAMFYIQKTLENSWSRVILEHQIELNLYKRQGKLQNNFAKTIKSNEIALINESDSVKP